MSLADTHVLKRHGGRTVSSRTLSPSAALSGAGWSHKLLLGMLERGRYFRRITSACKGRILNPEWELLLHNDALNSTR